MRNITVIRGAVKLLLFFTILTSATYAAATPATVPFSRFVNVSGVTDEGFNFLGSFEISSFFFDGVAIQADGILSGDIEQVGPVGEQFVSVPVTLIPDPTFCDLFTVGLGPADLDLLGVVHLDPVDLVLDVEAVPAGVDPVQLGDLLCSINTLLPRELTGVAAVLNEVLFLFP